MRPATVPAALRDRPFTTADARRHGLTPRMLAGPTWRRVTRGVYVHAAVPDSGHLRAAASGLALGPDAFVCGPTAAWVDGVAVGDADRPDAPVWVGRPAGRRPRRREGWRLQHLDAGPGHVLEWEGTPVRITSPVRTAFDCARWLAPVDATVVADALAHARLLTLDDLGRFAAARCHERGGRPAAGLLAMADGRSESPQETRLRLHFRRAGLRPEPQFVVRSAGLPRPARPGVPCGHARGRVRRGTGRPGVPTTAAVTGFATSAGP